LAATYTPSPSTNKRLRLMQSETLVKSTAHAQSIHIIRIIHAGAYK
jgi:hypothetical protein